MGMGIEGVADEHGKWNKHNDGVILRSPAAKDLA
jgi:hypothetical protein